jgi:hypothetical protein
MANARRQHPASIPPANHRAPANPSAPTKSPDLAHHRLKCRVCRHHDRLQIEQDFLRWRSPEKLAADFGIADHSSIYRHVHATGLYVRRQLSVRAALERIMERADEYGVPCFDVVRAVAAYSHMDDLGRWIQANPQVIIKVEQGSVLAEEFLLAQARREQANFNRQPGKLENAATR